ncbi:hypothetical protein [Sorangium sp. So ce233]|uniref:hypothetical protein n=1 Tax=Sorangium sp. So ce233 TaxID=3133290 RepID=UPI003F5FEAFB
MKHWIDSLFPEIPDDIREHFRAFHDVRTAWETSDDGVCMLRLARACAIDPRIGAPDPVLANQVMCAVAEPAVKLERMARARMDGKPITDPGDPVWEACHRTITDAHRAVEWTAWPNERTEAEGLGVDGAAEVIAARRLVADMVRTRLKELVVETGFRARVVALRR